MHMWAARVCLMLFAAAFTALLVPQSALATTTASNGVVIAEKWQQNTPLVVDYAGLLSDSEEAALLAQLEEISSRQGMDVAVVTDNQLYGKTAMEYADDYYDYGGLGQGAANSGILLSLNMADRSYWFSTAGDGISAFTDYGIDYIGDEIVGYLSGGNYYEAFSAYGELADSFITQWKEGAAYDVNNEVPQGYPLARNAVAAVAVGAVPALAAGGAQRSKLKSVRKAYSAEGYIVPGSMQLTDGHDLFTHRTMRRIPIPRDNGGHSGGGGGSSVHVSSGGVSHGGGGGHF